MHIKAAMLKIKGQNIVLRKQMYYSQLCLKITVVWNVIPCSLLDRFL